MSYSSLPQLSHIRAPVYTENRQANQQTQTYKLNKFNKTFMHCHTCNPVNGDKPSALFSTVGVKSKNAPESFKIPEAYEENTFPKVKIQFRSTFSSAFSKVNDYPYSTLSFVSCSCILFAEKETILCLLLLQSYSHSIKNYCLFCFTREQHCNIVML